MLIFNTTTLSDRNVVATKVGIPKTKLRVFELFKLTPQLKHRSARELWTTLHFLHSFFMDLYVSTSYKKSTNTMVYINFRSKISTYNCAQMYTIFLVHNNDKS